MLNSPFWLIDRALSGATTPGQSGPGSDGNEGVLRIPQSFSITRAEQSDCLVSCTGHALRESYPSAMMQSVYSAAPADWASVDWMKKMKPSKIVQLFNNPLTIKYV